MRVNLSINEQKLKWKNEKHFNQFQNYAAALLLIIKRLFCIKNHMFHLLATKNQHVYSYIIGESKEGASGPWAIRSKKNH